jgi:hypothetical protein
VVEDSVEDEDSVVDVVEDVVGGEVGGKIEILMGATGVALAPESEPVLVTLLVVWFFFLTSLPPCFLSARDALRQRLTWAS